VPSAVGMQTRGCLGVAGSSGGYTRDVTTIDTTIDVHADVDTVCDEWAQFSSTTAFEVSEVSFQPVDDDSTRIRLLARYEEDRPVDVAQKMITRDLERFRSSVESSGSDSRADGHEAPHAPRGGNSGSSIPPGTDAHEQLCGGHGDPQC
jgi:hypothetical protein